MSQRLRLCHVSGTSQLTLFAVSLLRLCCRSFVCCDPSCNLIAGGIKLHIFSANTTKTKETPSVAMYNEATQRFVTICGKSVREWSASTGKMISEYVPLNVVGPESVCKLRLDANHRATLPGTPT